MAAFRDLPAIDTLLSHAAIAPLAASYGRSTIKAALQNLQGKWRSVGALPDWATEPEAYAKELTSQLAAPGYQVVFNLSGTVIHTNLGRAPLSSAILHAIEPAVTRAVALEYDLGAGRRGDRDAVVTQRLQTLCGAEAATVVNNNAAALMLCLNTLALDARVPVSRGELIEIGGSFRLPELMRRAGCELLEVGTTNRTHLRDYASAIGPATTMLLKVHPSNFHIEGFTREVSIAELAELAHQHGLPLCVDLGSGTLVDLRRWGLPHEPMPQEALAQGADLVTFSGDKLLGSGQAGIIVGKAEYVEQLKTNPMKRALRADKVTLAYLAETLRYYEDPSTLPEHIPLLRQLTTPVTELGERGEALRDCLAALVAEYSVELVDSDCQIGSGSLPDQRVPSKAVRVSHAKSSAVMALGRRLRELPKPVIGRMHQDALWLDLRCAEPFGELLENLQLLQEPSHA